MTAPPSASDTAAHGPREVSPQARRWIAGATYFLLVCTATTVAGTALATLVLVGVLAVVRPPLAYERVEAREFVLPFLALLGLILIAAVLNGDRANALREANEYRLLVFPLMLLFTLPYVGTRRMLRVLCVAATLMAVYGVYQYATGTDPLYWYRTDYARARGGFSNPLSFANYLLLLLPVFALLARAETGVWRHLWAVGGAAAAVGIVLSLSRSGVVGLAAAAWVLLFRWRRRVALWALGVGVAGVALLVAFAGPIRDVLPEPGNSRAADLVRRYVLINPLEDPSLRDRLYIWEAGLSGWRDHKLLGFGSGMHSYHLEPYQRAVAESHGHPDYEYTTGYNPSLHNMLIRMLFDLGVMGLAVYGWMWAVVFFAIRDGLRGGAGSDPWRAALLWGLAAGFVGLNVAGLFEDNFFDAEVQTLALILMMLAFHASRATTREP